MDLWTHYSLFLVRGTRRCVVHDRSIDRAVVPGITYEYQAGDTNSMGGGYFLYDTCGDDLLALGPDGHPRARSSSSRCAPMHPSRHKPLARHKWCLVP